MAGAGGATIRAARDRGQSLKVQPSPGVVPVNQRNKTLVAALVLGALLAALALAFVAVGPLSPLPWLILAGAAGIPWLLRRETCRDFVAWRDDYSVGLDILDDEHKRLLALINNVLAANQCGTGTVLERQALDELLAYTEYHFKREEDLMVEHGYRDYEGHKAQHDQMRTQVKLYLKRYEERGREVLPELANHLKLWLLQHIAGTDKRLAPYVAGRTRAAAEAAAPS
jgi:hemerythrin-like metal-binding protein